jgi:hypothetical protein
LNYFIFIGLITPMFYVLFCIQIIFANNLSPHNRYLRWVQQWDIIEHPEENYHFYSEIHHEIANKVRDSPGVITPFRIGRTVEKRSIWAFRIKNPKTTPNKKILIFAGLHPLEWVGVESAFEALLVLATHPPDNVEVVIIPVLNIDRRLVVERDLMAENRKYRRVNSGGEDLNREFEIHRNEPTIWRHVFTERYETSTHPLSQPESQSLDKLASEGFDAAISLHCFGGYIYYPWAGSYERPPDWRKLHNLALLMKQAQPHNHQYRVKQLSHWMLFFRPQGTEIDHLYGKYGIFTFLIEMTRSGIVWHDRDTWKDPFRMYNPITPQIDISRGRESILSLVRFYDFYDSSLDELEEPTIFHP